jgi:hypothetical protein
MTTRNTAASPDDTTTAQDAMTQVATGGTIVVKELTTRNWFAWNDLMPPQPPSFHIIGDVQVPNPGVDLLLTEKVPQGINPTIILLDLHFIQRPGIWPQMVVTKQVRFDKARAQYSRAEVFSGSVKIADIPVVDVL